MLTLSSSAAYVYEPLRSIRWTDSALDTWSEEEIKRIVPKMDGIYKCVKVSQLAFLSSMVAAVTTLTCRPPQFARSDVSAKSRSETHS